MVQHRKYPQKGPEESKEHYNRRLVEWGTSRKQFKYGKYNVGVPNNAYWKKKKKLKKLRKKALKLLKQWKEVGELICEPLASDKLEVTCKLCGKPAAEFNDIDAHTTECEKRDGRE